MNLLVRFLFSLYLLLLIGQTHLKAHTSRYDIARISTKIVQDSPHIDHCRTKSVIITTSPSRKEKEHNEIEIVTKENKDEDDERNLVNNTNYFTTFFYAQAPEYFPCSNQHYLSCRDLFLHRYSRYIVFHVFRI